MLIMYLIGIVLSFLLSLLSVKIITSGKFHFENFLSNDEDDITGITGFCMIFSALSFIGVVIQLFIILILIFYNNIIIKYDLINKLDTILDNFVLNILHRSDK